MRRRITIVAGISCVIAATAIVTVLVRESTSSKQDLVPPKPAFDVPPFATEPNEVAPINYLTDPDAARLPYWRAKPLPNELAGLSLKPRVTDAVRADAERLKAGQFRPFRNFEWLPLGVPPPWDDNPVGSPTWDLWRHTLSWIEPLVATWRTDGDQDSLRLIQDIVRDWSSHNNAPPGASRQAWSDHASAERLKNLCRIWELYRTSPAPDIEFSRLLLEQINAHAEFIASGVNYNGKSNHGLMQNVALLQAA